jgi:aspartyl-tRNA(Asn)/glutamyl-tRNA(Gln) amidotransferase subunit B
MEQGNMRCDANISLRLLGEKTLGTKVEIKNMNSFKMIERALEYEVGRQADMLDNGEHIIQETRGWDDAKGITTGQRSKEEANDYRYFPEPDLPPVEVASSSISLDEVHSWLPELPKDKEVRFISEYGLSEADAKQLTSDLELARYFEKAIGALTDDFLTTDELKRNASKKIANWIVGELIGKMNKFSVQLSDIKTLPEDITELFVLIDSGTISGKQAKDVFEKMFETGEKPTKIVEASGLGQISDTSELERMVEGVLQSNEKSVEDFAAGKQQAFGYLMGQVMVATKGQANPKMVSEILREKLK